MESEIAIQNNQIQEITNKGVCYKDVAGDDVFIDFDACYQEQITVWNHPNVKAMNMKSRYRDEYLGFLDNLKTKKVVGCLSPNGGLFAFGTGKPFISIGHVQIKFTNMKDYVDLREKLLRKDVHFIIRMFEII